MIEAETGPDNNTAGFEHRLKEIFKSLSDLESKIIIEFPEIDEFDELSDFDSMNYSRGPSGMAQLIKSRIKKLAIYTDTNLDKRKSSLHETLKTGFLGTDSEITEKTSSDKKISVSSNAANKRLEKLESEIQEKKLESIRRKEVTESKMYGGFIEVITSLRNELKRRDENSKEISALKTHVQKLEEKIGSFIESTPQKSTQNREEQWYDDIVRKNKGVIYGGMKMQKKLVIPTHLEQVLQAFLLTFQRYFHLCC